MIIMANKPQTWRISENKYFPCEDASTTLPAAHYEMRSGHNTGIHFVKTPLATDELIEAIDPVSDKVIEEIKKFWTRKEKFKKLGMLWKRGMFFWGPPGGGKTSLVNIICKWVIAQGGISVYVDYPSFAGDGLKMIRDIEPDRPMVVVLEDFDDMMREFSESTILNLIDGETQIDNIIFLATANSPEKLEKRVLNRPGRFDLVMRVGLPSAETRRAFLLSKAPEMKDSPDLDKWVEDTKGLSIAHLRDLLISVIGLENPYDEVIGRLTTMNTTEPCSDDKDEEVEDIPFGFHPSKVVKVDTKKLDLEVRRREPITPIDPFQFPRITIVDD